MIPEKELKEETEKYLKEEILGTPPLSSKGLRVIDGLLVKLLKESNQQIRDELRAFLKRWELRTLFLDALQEAKDMKDEAESKNRTDKRSSE